MKTIIWIITIITSTYIVNAQTVDIEVNSRIIGNLDVCQANDPNSVHIGRNAGINTQFNTLRSNTFIGGSAGQANTIGDGLVFVGAYAGSENTTGVNNTFVGRGAGQFNTTGNTNSFFGTWAGGLNTTGYRNSAFGMGAGIKNTEGIDNVYLGFNAGYDNEKSWNVMIGSKAGIYSTGSNNVYIGRETAQKCTSGSNVFVGDRAAKDLNTGFHNVFIGRVAGATQTSGSENVYIGSNTYGAPNAEKNVLIGAFAFLGENVRNSIAIGHNANVTSSNTIRLGNQHITRIEGQVPFSSSSDRRLKENIIDVSLGLDFIKLLRPVAYNRINDSSEEIELGLIAQEVKLLLDAYPDLKYGMIQQDTEEGYMSIRYNDFIALLIKSIQELSTRVLALEQSMEE